VKTRHTQRLAFFHAACAAKSRRTRRRKKEVDAVEMGMAGWGSRRSSWMAVVVRKEAIHHGLI